MGGVTPAPSLSKGVLFWIRPAIQPGGCPSWQTCRDAPLSLRKRHDHRPHRDVPGFEAVDEECAGKVPGTALAI